jgi:uric acid transporter
LIGLIPKAGAIVAAIPPSVLGGAALVMFGTVAAVGIQTLGRVDFTNHRNVVVVAVSIGVAMIPVGTPVVNGASAFYSQMPSSLQTFLSSGITAGSVTAILLNLFLNHFGGKTEEVEQTGKVTIEALNAMPEDEFVRVVGPAYQGSAGIAEYVADERPFADANDLRAAMQNRLFALSPEEQLALMEQYPNLASKMVQTGELGNQSIIDQAAAGLTFLSEEQQDVYDQVTKAYRDKFGFPLIVAVRELSPENVLDQAFNRLDNSPTQERQAAVLEIAKIANHRLADVVEGTEPMGELRSSTMARIH